MPRGVRLANGIGGGQGTLGPDRIAGGRHVRIEFRGNPEQACQTRLTVGVDRQDPIATKTQNLRIRQDC